MNCFWAGQVCGNLGSHKEYAVYPLQFRIQSFSVSCRLLVLTTEYVVMEFRYVLPGFDTASGHLILMLFSAVRNRVKYCNFSVCHLKSWLSPGSSLTAWSLTSQLPFLFLSLRQKLASWYVLQTDLKLVVILLPQPPWCWDYRCVQTQLAHISPFVLVVDWY